MIHITQRDLTIGDPRAHVRESILAIIADDGERLSVSVVQNPTEPRWNAMSFAYALRQLSDAMIEKFQMPVEHYEPKRGE